MKDHLRKLTDEELMAHYQKGEAAAFEELICRYKDRVFHYFLRMIRNQQAAEEAVQEVFLHVIRAAKNYEPRARFGTWMYRIMYNYGVDVHRRNRLRKTQSLDQPRVGRDGAEDESNTLLSHIADPKANLENETIDQDLHDQLTAALEQLNPDQREVFLMRENMGLAFHEIASMLNVSTNTVKSRMRYALAALRKILEPRFSGASNKSASKKIEAARP